MFERFFHEEKSRSHTGNGLGLAIVKKIIQLHDG
ncbi:sensor histidine kinase, partial [Francisella tularensis subsp. holarctica]|nr:sensor histidine kinase [Francisella tularensis subsp. holarctica]